MLHIPVLLEESLDFLLNDLSGTYLDLTFGRGSHSQAILDRISPSARLFAIDRDLEAIAYAKKI
jgi:16S rRNA (cytosine1402-N4)-methyltransferase